METEILLIRQVYYFHHHHSTPIDVSLDSPAGFGTNRHKFQPGFGK